MYLPTTFIQSCDNHFTFAFYISLTVLNNYKVHIFCCILVVIDDAWWKKEVGREEVFHYSVNKKAELSQR